jgi:hypothetical protein
MDAFGLHDEQRGGGRRKRVVLISRRWDQVCGDDHRRRWLEKPGHRGEHVISRNPLRGECRRSRRTCGDLLAYFLHLHARLRVRSLHRRSLRPLTSRGTCSCTTRACSCRGNAESYSLPRDIPSAVVPRLDRGIQYPRDVSRHTTVSGILSRPVPPTPRLRRGLVFARHAEALAKAASRATTSSAV